MPGIGIISNPKSKQNLKHPEKMRTLARLVEGFGEAKETRDLDELHQVAQQFLQKGTEIVCINGGDGSSHIVVDAFLHTAQQGPLPLFVMLRGGTLNTIATGIGIRGTPESILYNVVQKYNTKTPFQIKQVKTVKADDKHGFIFGNGVIYNFMQAYYGTGRPSTLTAAKQFSRLVGSIAVGGSFADQVMKRLQATIYADGQRWDQKSFFTVAIASVPQIGLGFTPWYRAEEDPERLHVLGVFCSAGRFVMQLPNIYRARPMQPECLFDTLAKEITFETNSPTGFMLDGDLYLQSSNLLKICTGRSIQVIVE